MAAQCNCCKWCEIDDFHLRQHFALHIDALVETIRNMTGKDFAAEARWATRC